MVDKLRKRYNPDSRKVEKKGRVRSRKPTSEKSPADEDREAGDRPAYPNEQLGQDVNKGPRIKDYSSSGNEKKRLAMKRLIKLRSRKQSRKDISYYLNKKKKGE
ncbi:MAG: hypothetical protein DRQ88_09305 [Epsilonproteobacteria bacterium]|nr:MAG: hypothetical protein DRQ88_09305 [Campylobacterota bacterium]